MTELFLQNPAIGRIYNDLVANNPEVDPLDHMTDMAKSSTETLLPSLLNTMSESAGRSLVERFNKIAAEPRKNYQAQAYVNFANEMAEVANQKHEDRKNFLEKAPDIFGAKTGPESLDTLDRTQEFYRGDAPTSSVVQALENTTREIVGGAALVLDEAINIATGEDTEGSLASFGKQMFEGRGKLPDAYNDAVFPLDPQIWATGAARNLPSTVMTAAAIGSAFVSGPAGPAATRGLTMWASKAMAQKISKVGGAALFSQSAGSVINELEGTSATPRQKLFAGVLSGGSDWLSEKLGNAFQTGKIAKGMSPFRMELFTKTAKDPTFKAKILELMGKNSKVLWDFSKSYGQIQGTEVAEEMLAEMAKIAVNNFVFQPQIAALRNTKEMLAADPTNKDLIADVKKLEDEMESFNLNISAKDAMEIVKGTFRDTNFLALVGGGSSAYIRQKRRGKLNKPIVTDDPERIQFVTDLNIAYMKESEGILNDESLTPEERGVAEDNLNKRTSSKIRFHKHLVDNDIDNDQIQELNDKMDSEAPLAQTDDLVIKFINEELGKVYAGETSQEILKNYVANGGMRRGTVSESTLKDPDTASRMSTVAAYNEALIRTSTAQAETDAQEAKDLPLIELKAQLQESILAPDQNPDVLDKFMGVVGPEANVEELSNFLLSLDQDPVTLSKVLKPRIKFGKGKYENLKSALDIVVKTQTNKEKATKKGLGAVESAKITVAKIKNITSEEISDIGKELDAIDPTDINIKGKTQDIVNRAREAKSNKTFVRDISRQLNTYEHKGGVESKLNELEKETDAEKRRDLQSDIVSEMRDLRTSAGNRDISTAVEGVLPSKIKETTKKLISEAKDTDELKGLRKRLDKLRDVIKSKIAVLGSSNEGMNLTLDDIIEAKLDLDSKINEIDSFERLGTEVESTVKGYRKRLLKLKGELVTAMESLATRKSEAEKVGVSQDKINTAMTHEKVTQEIKSHDEIALDIDSRIDVLEIRLQQIPRRKVGEKGKAVDELFYAEAVEGLIRNELVSPMEVMKHNANTSAVKLESLKKEELKKQADQAEKGEEGTGTETGTETEVKEEKTDQEEGVSEEIKSGDAMNRIDAESADGILAAFANNKKWNLDKKALERLVEAIRAIDPDLIGEIPAKELRERLKLIKTAAQAKHKTVPVTPESDTKSQEVKEVKTFNEILDAVKRFTSALVSTTPTTLGNTIKNDSKLLDTVLKIYNPVGEVFNREDVNRRSAPRHTQLRSILNNVIDYVDARGLDILEKAINKKYEHARKNNVHDKEAAWKSFLDRIVEAREGLLNPKSRKETLLHIDDAGENFLNIFISSLLSSNRAQEFVRGVELDAMRKVFSKMKSFNQKTEEKTEQKTEEKTEQKTEEKTTLSEDDLEGMLDDLDEQDQENQAKEDEVNQDEVSIFSEVPDINPKTQSEEMQETNLIKSQGMTLAIGDALTKLSNTKIMTPRTNMIQAFARTIHGEIFHNGLATMKAADFFFEEFKHGVLSMRRVFKGKISKALESELSRAKERLEGQIEKKAKNIQKFKDAVHALSDMVDMLNTPLDDAEVANSQRQFPGASQALVRAIGRKALDVGKHSVPIKPAQEKRWTKVNDEIWDELGNQYVNIKVPEFKKKTEKKPDPEVQTVNGLAKTPSEIVTSLIDSVDLDSEHVSVSNKAKILRLLSQVTRDVYNVTYTPTKKLLDKIRPRYQSLKNMKDRRKELQAIKDDPDFTLYSEQVDNMLSFWDQKISEYESFAKGKNREEVLGVLDLATWKSDIDNIRLSYLNEAADSGGISHFNKKVGLGNIADTTQAILLLPQDYVTTLLMSNTTNNIEGTNTNIKEMKDVLNSALRQVEHGTKSDNKLAKRKLESMLGILKYEEKRRIEARDVFDAAQLELSNMNEIDRLDTVAEKIAGINSDINKTLESLGEVTDLDQEGYTRLIELYQDKYETIRALHYLNKDTGAGIGTDYTKTHMRVHNLAEGHKISSVPSIKHQDPPNVQHMFEPAKDNAAERSELSPEAEELVEVLRGYAREHKGFDASMVDPVIGKPPERHKHTIGYVDKDTDRIVIFMDNIRNKEALIEVLRHEDFGHIILENILGIEGFQKLVDFTIKNGGLGVENMESLRALYNARLKKMDKDAKPLTDRQVAYEVIAHYAQKTENVKPLSFMQKVVSRIRRWIKKHVGMEMSERDVFDIIRDAYANYREGTHIGRPVHTENEVFLKFIDEGSIPFSDHINLNNTLFSYQNDLISRTGDIWKRIYIGKEDGDRTVARKIFESLQTDHKVGGNLDDFLKYLTGEDNSGHFEGIESSNKALGSSLAKTREIYTQHINATASERRKLDQDQAGLNDSKFTKMKKATKGLTLKKVKKAWTSLSTTMRAPNAIRLLTAFSRGNPEFLKDLIPGQKFDDGGLDAAFAKSELDPLNRALGFLDDANSTSFSESPNGLYFIDPIVVEDGLREGAPSLVKQKVGKSLLQELQPYLSADKGEQANTDVIDEYLKAKRVLDRERRGMIIDDVYGPARARQTVKELQGSMVKNGVGVDEAILRYYRNMATVMEDSGQFTQDRIARMKTRTAVELLDAKERGISIERRASGKHLLPLESVMAETSHVFQKLGSKNFDVKLIEYVRRVNDHVEESKDFITEIEEDGLAELDKGFVSPILEVRKAAFEEHNAKGLKRGSSDFIYQIMENGQPKYLRIKDKSFYQSIQARRDRFMDPTILEEMNWTVRNLVTLGRFQSKLIRSMTVYNPAFIMRNVFMDVVGAWGMGFTDASKLGKLASSPSYLKGVIAEMEMMGSFDAARSLNQDTNGEDLMKKSTEWLRKNGSGKQTFIDNTKDGISYVKSVADWALKHSEAIGRSAIVETTIARNADYFNADGLSKNERDRRFKKVAELAHGRSRDIMDFQTFGKNKAVNSWMKSIAFGRVGLTALDKSLRLPREIYSDPILRNKFMIRSAGLAMFTAYAALQNLDDEEYMEAPAYVKASIWSFKIGDTRINIRKPFGGGGLISNVVESYIYGANREGGSELAQHIGKDIINGVLPNLPVVRETLQWGLGRIGLDDMNPALAATPDLIKLGWALGTNTDQFRNAPIVPTFLNSPHTPDEAKYTGRESKLAITLGQLMGVSPIKIEFVKDQITGGVTDYALYGVKKTINTFAGENVVGDMDNPLFNGQFETGTRFLQGSMNRFYKKYNEMRGYALAQSRAKKLDGSLKDTILRNNESRAMNAGVIRKLKRHFNWLKRMNKSLNKIEGYQNLSRSGRLKANRHVYVRTSELMREIRILEDAAR